jgi:YesN/AraC family two-component response regulator
MIQTSYKNISSNLESVTVKDASAKYASIRIEEEKINEICQKISHLMETEKPYISMNFNLMAMSKKLDILPNILSMVINTKFNTNFPDFINTYRIKHALTLLAVFEERNLTIESVAYESGFNNRTSFYNSFKKQTGRLPLEYLRNRTYQDKS